jgi:membrane protein YdbS with pleckstrin-like domain
MKCQKCGTELATGAAFCQACGAAVSRAPASGAAAAAAPAAPTSPAKQKLAGAGGAEDKEETLWEGYYSKLAMIGAWVAAGVLTVAVLVVGLAARFDGTGWLVALGALAVAWLGLALRLWYLQLSIKYSLTNQRFIFESGLLWRKMDRIETIDIDDVEVVQGPIERMLGTGTIKVQSSDVSTPNFAIVGIENAKQVAALIDDARRQERRKRGLYVESV